MSYLTFLLCKTLWQLSVACSQIVTGFAKTFMTVPLLALVHLWFCLPWNHGGTELICCSLCCIQRLPWLLLTYARCVSSVFLHRLFLWPRIFLPHACFLCCVMVSIHRFLWRLGLFPCFLYKEMPTGHPVLIMMMQEGGQRFCHWAVSAEEDGNFSPICHLPSEDHGLLACKKPGSLLSTFLHFQELFSLLCPVYSFLYERQIGEHFIIVSLK